MNITWDATWNTGPAAQRKSTVLGAMERIERMVQRSSLAVNNVKPPTAMPQQEARTHYVQHFNDATLAELTHVKGIIKLMHDRVCKSNQTINMSYVPDLMAYNALGVGPLPAGVNLQNVEAFVVQRGVAPGTALTVYVAPSFFRGNVYVQKNVNQRTGTGTILHELSHGVGSTLDHAYTWAATYATLTANQRARNADTYRAYCQSFDA